MSKLKTNKAAKKRFKITGSGKVVASRSKRRHLLGDKVSSKKRRLRKPWTLEGKNREAVIRSLPYG